MTYNVKDSSENEAEEVTRTVKVIAVPDTTKPIITLLGESSITIYEGSSYTDAGATANDNIDGDISANIVVNNPVVSNTIGEYTVTYNVKDSSENEAEEVTRTVKVIAVPDTTKPIITLLGESSITIYEGSSYTDAGATANDNIDGDISANIVVNNPVVSNTIGEYTVTYNVKDSSENEAEEVTRTVKVIAVPDTTKPIITLLGESSITIYQGSTYSDAGATASDNIDGDISANIVVNNPVDTTTLGSYTVTYNVNDAMGNSAVQVNRTVEVIDTTANYNIAIDNSVREVKAEFEGFTVIVYTDRALEESPSNSTKAVYGNINGNNTASLLKINDNYSDGDAFIVKVYEDDVLVGESTKALLSGDVLNFSDITTK